MSKLGNVKFWLVAIILIFSLTGIANASVNAGKYTLITDSLAAQMRRDTADRNLAVDITRAGDMRISGEKQVLFGEARYISGKEKKAAPIYFEIIVEMPGNRVSSVDYVFLENGSPVSEAFLQKLVIKQLGNDLRTQNIVMSLDAVEQVEQQSGQVEKFRGVGEVEIGGLVVKKIKFEITLENDSERVLYKLSDL